MLKTKDWRLGSMYDIKIIAMQFYVLSRSRLHGQFSVCDSFYLPHKNASSFSANITVIPKLVNFVHLYEQIKIVT